MTDDMFTLDGRVAVVSGAAQGIGRTIAAAYARAGVAVACLDLVSADFGPVLGDIDEAGSSGFAIGADVTDEAGVRDAARAASDALGPISIAFFAAGINRGGSPAEDYDIDVWRRVLDVNLTGIMVCCKVFGTAMLEYGRGSIVNVASMSGIIVNRGLFQPDYNASKAGVRHLTKCLAVEWATRGVRVNSISPGYVATPLTESSPDWPRLREQFSNEVPMGEIATPADIVGGAVYLASDASRFVTGHDLVIDGGFTCW